MKRAAGVLALWMLLAGAAPLFAQGPPGGKKMPPQVTLAPAVVKTVPVSFEYVGLTEASKTVEVRARIQGFLETREFQDGAYLKEGTRLFTIDPRPFEADRDVAAAQVAQAAARLRLAEQELARLKAVRTPGAVAAADVDQREAEAAGAAASLRLAEAQLKKAELNLDYTRVSAPLTGFIGKAQKEAGSYVDSAQNSLLAVMHQVDPLYVTFKVSEADFLAWRRGEKEGALALAGGRKVPDVAITLLDGTPFGESGTLDYENTGVDTQTGTVELRATFKNGDRALKPGQFVKVNLSGWERPNVLTVPRRAVGQTPKGPVVYLVGPDSKAQERVVRTGEWSGEDWIILEGLEAGDQVIVDGLTKVRAGTEVSTGPPPGAPGAADAAKPAAPAR